MRTDLKNDTYGKKDILVYYLIYTAVFVIFAAAVYIPFWTTGTGFIFETDGLVQHYYALMYYGRWLRGIWDTLITTHRLSVPLWDFSIGYGSDILTTFSYYVIGDPLALSSFFVPEKYTEYLYDALVVIRFYLAGASFSAFCLSKKKGKAATLAGALTYAFCAYAVHAGIKHPFFINPMIYFPLLLIGAERVFNKKKPGFFIFMVFVSALSNFYFFYMLALGIAIYVVFRFFTFRHERVLRELGQTLLRFLLYGITGTAMSMVLFLPTLLLFGDTLRSQAQTPAMILYPAGYYWNFILGYLTGPVGGAMYWTYLGYAWPVVPALIMLFTRRTDPDRAAVNRVLKIAFAVMTAMLLIPVFGRIFNGFAYVSNRWVWIYSALVAFILTETWEDMADLARRKLRYTKPFAVCVFALMCVHLGANSIYRYNSHFGNRISLYLPFGSAYGKLQKSEIKELSELSSKSSGESGQSFWRYEKSKYSMENETVISRQNGVQYYWSLASSAPSQFQLDLQLNPMCTYNYMGLNSRTFLDALAGVKYYCAATGGAPYGYRKVMDGSETESGYRIYENKYALPLGYTYSSILSSAAFDSMDPLERAEAMLQGVMLDDDDAAQVENSDSSITEADPVTDRTELACTVEEGNDCRKINDNTYELKKSSASINVSFSGMKNCETYILIRGLKADTQKDVSMIRIKVRGRKTVQTYYIKPDNRSYYGQDDILVNLGYYQDAQTAASISAEFAGRYSFDEIKVFCQPMDSYVSSIKALSEDTLDAEEGVNTVSGSISLDHSRILCLSIPWSKGWTAQVDGKKADIMRANEMYMAVYLPAGEHEVVLHYRTPGLAAGAAGSLAGWAAFAAVLALAAGKRRKKIIQGDHNDGE